MPAYPGLRLFSTGNEASEALLKESARHDCKLVAQRQALMLFGLWHSIPVTLLSATIHQPRGEFVRIVSEGKADGSWERLSTYHPTPSWARPAWEKVGTSKSSEWLVWYLNTIASPTHPLIPRQLTSFTLRFDGSAFAPSSAMRSSATWLTLPCPAF
jgi:hypothetical protein